MLKLSSGDFDAIRAFKSEPSNRKHRYALNTIYWEYFYKIIRTQAEGGSAKNLNLNEYKDFINIGLLDVDLLEKGKDDLAEIQKGDVFVDDPNIFTFGSWIEKEYQHTLNFDKRDHLKTEITAIEHDLKTRSNELTAKQDDRRNVFMSTIDSVLAMRGMMAMKNQYVTKYERIKNAEEMKYNILVNQKEISTGKFLDVKVKRDLSDKIKEQGKLVLAFKNLITELKNPVIEKEILSATEEIETLIAEIVEIESRKHKKEAALKTIVTQTATLSPQEVEAAINEVLDYFKGLMTLCAKRVKAEPFSVLAGKSKPVTEASLKNVIHMIEEFDPRVFKNDRVKYLGLPKFVIIPGHGNSLYDWKNNAILVPTVPFGRLEDSLFSGVVEYKLDMDDDKALLMSYNKLEDNKGMKSHLRLKEKFAKDYAIYMGQEIKGYKVMSKDLRNWFNHEIAPNRFEIKIPLEFDPITMSKEDYESLQHNLKSRIDNKTATAKDFYGMGIFESYNESFEKAMEYFKKAYEISPTFLDALYNLATICMKKSMRREAALYFTEFVKKSPQNWWTGVCQEHLMKLK